jgi:hypothetical protein
MKKANNIVIIMFFACSLLPIIYCTGPDLAGGAGTGNPGKTTFAIVARDTITTTSLQKSVSAGEIIIPDSSKKIFHVDSFSVILRRIHFVFSPEDKSRIDEISVLPPLQIERKDSSIVLEGPFIFNALTGIPDSVFGTVLLPDANYKSVKLVIENKPNKNSIFLGGTFRHLDKIHKFKFDLSLNASVTYENEKGVYVSGTDSTDMKVELDASKWLANINITGCINSQATPFDTNGVFILNGKISDGSCAEIPRKINENIVNSGKLKIKQVKLK